MSYQKMLSAYIRLIINEESVDYLNCADDKLKQFGLSVDEIAELKRIGNEWLGDDWKHDLGA
jgi:hypothetical protein